MVELDDLLSVVANVDIIVRDCDKYNAYYDCKESIDPPMNSKAVSYVTIRDGKIYIEVERGY